MANEQIYRWDTPAPLPLLRSTPLRFLCEIHELVFGFALGCDGKCGRQLVSKFIYIYIHSIYEFVVMLTKFVGGLCTRSHYTREFGLVGILCNVQIYCVCALVKLNISPENKLWNKFNICCDCTGWINQQNFIPMHIFVQQEMCDQYFQELLYLTIIFKYALHSGKKYECNELINYRKIM